LQLRITAQIVPASWKDVSPMKVTCDSRRLKVGAEAICSYDSRHRATWSGGGGFEDRACIIGGNGLAFELHSV
jgi:hypothetical protein